MNTKRALLLMITLLFAASFPINAGQLNLEPAKVTFITSPENSRDTRVLIFFNLPNELKERGVEIEHAVLILNGQVRDADFGQIDVFPVTTAWAQTEAVSWISPWNEAGVDYTGSYMGRSVILGRDEGEKSIRLNVTFMVKAWLDGFIDNNGMVVVPAQDELHRTQVKYYFGEDDILLKIAYDHMR
jgi:hypothetical protein